MTKHESTNFKYCLAIQLFALSIVFLMGGCATDNKSVGLGAGLGVGAGAIAGGLADPGKDGQYRTRNVIVGAALGGMAGMVAGSVIHSELEDQKKEAYSKGRASSPSPKTGAMPALKSAKVDSRWVEAHSVSNRYIEGHFEYIITEPARWDESQ
ncbi:MAG: hypothetical protein SGJ18_02245 [Pseudomonadota bacterium]|nr:hypothetical protein [Pseudomonadota bacterium]